MGLLGAAGIGAHAYRLARADTAPIVQTAEISRGDIIDAVATTGTVQAVTTVQVGSQASGNISRLGADFNSIVHNGQRLADARSVAVRGRGRAGSREPESDARESDQGSERSRAE